MCGTLCRRIMNIIFKIKTVTNFYSVDPLPKYKAKNFVNRSFSNFRLIFNRETNSWELGWDLGQGGRRIAARLRSTYDSIALGTHQWTIFNDTKNCNRNEGDSYTTTLTFSACNLTEFTCKCGNCIPMDRRCDGKIDCFDKSDEMDCEIILEDVSYNKRISPPAAENMDTNDVHISVDILRILKVDEIEEGFEVKFNLYATWKDPRLTYLNLKRNENLNVLDHDDKKSIWTPVIIFENTKASDRSKIDEESLIRVLPHEKFKYTASDIQNHENIYYFKGSENSLELSRTYRINFICSYDMALFPFDTQTCTMNFELNMVKLVIFFFSFLTFFFFSRFQQHLTDSTPRNLTTLALLK